eukprot:9494861-Pyramimonas_sp.AAC.1
MLTANSGMILHFARPDCGGVSSGLLVSARCLNVHSDIAGVNSRHPEGSRKGYGLVWHSKIRVQIVGMSRMVCLFRPPGFSSGGLVLTAV